MTKEDKERLWDWPIRVAAVLSLVVAILVGIRSHQYTNCKSDYDDRAAKAAAARTEAAAQDRAAEDAMWQAFADAGDPTKVPPAQARDYARAAFQKFVKERADANRQRAENPPPPPPSVVCE